MRKLLNQLLLSVVCSSVLYAEAAKPNIVFIMADDLGFETMGSFGGTSYKTPNLDRLAAKGARFEHCYSQPVCTPSRVKLMTGKSNVRNYKGFGQLPRGEKHSLIC